MIIAILVGNEPSISQVRNVYLELEYIYTIGIYMMDKQFKNARWLTPKIDCLNSKISSTVHNAVFLQTDLETCDKLAQWRVLSELNWISLLCLIGWIITVYRLHIKVIEYRILVNLEGARLAISLQAGPWAMPPRRTSVKCTRTRQVRPLVGESRCIGI